MLPTPRGKTYVVAWNGTSTKLVDVYSGATTVAHPAWQMLPINSMTITAQAWCGMNCFKTVQLAPGNYSFSIFATGTKTRPLMAAKAVAIQGTQIYVLDFIGSASSNPSSVRCLVLAFAPTKSLSGSF